jgi:hypothetical protein
MIIKLLNVFYLIIVILILLATFFIVRPYSRLLLTLFPPSNLYTPLVDQPIDLNEKKELPTFILVHKYVGTYLVGIYIEKPPPFGVTIDSNAIVCLKIFNDRNILFDETFTSWAERFGGLGTEAGVMLGYYRVPNNIPLRENTQAVISVVSPDPKFGEKYGKLSFFITRITDQ